MTIAKCAAGVLAALPLLAVSAHAASAAPDAVARENWRAALVRAVGSLSGCFKANYPDAAWTRTSCAVAPSRAYIPRHGNVADVGTNTVGNGHDYAAGTSTLTTSGVGSFPVVTGLTSEKGSLNRANTYSLQLNSNFFSTSVCNGATNPSSCLGWQQFVYSNSGTAFMQYWLINYGTTCPAGGNWIHTGSDCYKNSAAVAVPRQVITQLSHLSVTGKAVAAGTDTMIMTTATSAYMTTGPDSVVNLADSWNASEFNVIGDGGGSKAKFNTGTSLTVHIALQDGATAAPTCETNAGTTGETNNLNLGACTASSGASPSIQFVESN